jgi:5-formyltetrahydrofolate cyclo-ligase
VAPAIWNKQNLREQALEKRDGLAMPDRYSAAQGLVEKAPIKVAEKCFSAYHAIGSEIDPAPLVAALVSQGSRLALPVLLDQTTMVFRRWDPGKSLVPVGFGTLGPDADQPEMFPDLILAPLAAFSSAGQRIGYGKGHYDRCLSKMHAAGHFPGFVGLAFEEQEVPPFATEAHDIPLHGVLTPSGLRIFDHGQEVLAPFLASS